MYKKVLTLLICFLPLRAMEPLEKSNTIRVQPSDSNQEFEIELRLANLSETLKGPIEENLIRKDADTKLVIPLPNITVSTWTLIQNQLECVFHIQNEPTEAESTKESLIAAIQALDGETFVELLIAVSYLDITLLQDLITRHYELKELTYDQFFTFFKVYKSPDLGKALIVRYLVAKLGPFQAPQTAINVEYANFTRSVCVDGDKIVSGSRYRDVCAWDITTGKRSASWKGHFPADVTSVSVAGDKIVSVSDTAIDFWNLTTGEHINLLKGNRRWVYPITCLAGDKLVLGFGDNGFKDNNTIHIWDMTTSRFTASCVGHTENVTLVYATEDKIASGSEDNTVRVWDLTTGEEIAIFRGHTSRVNAVCAAGDNIVSGSNDNTVRAWDLVSEELTALYEGHTGPIIKVFLSGDKIVSHSEDNTIRVWSLTTKKLIAVCEGHGDRIFSVSVTKDKIVAGSVIGILVWDLATGKQIAVWKGYGLLFLGPLSVHLVCVTDNKIVSCADDASIRVLDISVLNLLRVIDTQKARAVCNYLKITHSNNANHHWQEIVNILNGSKEEETNSSSTCLVG